MTRITNNLKIQLQADMNSSEQKTASEHAQLPSGWSLYQQTLTMDDYWLRWENQKAVMLPKNIYNIVAAVSKCIVILSIAVIAMFGVYYYFLIVAAFALVIYLFLEFTGTRHNFTYLNVTPAELRVFRTKHEIIREPGFGRRSMKTFPRTPETTRVEILHRAKKISSEDGPVFITYSDIILVQAGCKPECIATYTDNILAEKVAAFFTKLIENGGQE